MTYDFLIFFLSKIVLEHVVQTRSYITICKNIEFFHKINQGFRLLRYHKMPGKLLEIPAEPPKRSWTLENLQPAISDVRTKKKTAYRASKFYGIPKSTLLRNLKCNNENSSVELQSTGRKTILGAVVECELVKYLKEIKHQYFGLTRGDLMKCAYKICVKKGIPHPFNSKKRQLVAVG